MARYVRKTTRSAASMMPPASSEQAVREAAETLHAAIMAARDSGYVVTWPRRPEDLTSIAISTTRKGN